MLCGRRLVQLAGSSASCREATRNARSARSPLDAAVTAGQAWYVLQGRVRVREGDAEIDGEPGSFVLAPRGVAHTFARLPGDDLKLLLFIAPAGLERMFDEVANLSEGEQQDPSVLGDIAARYGVQALGPPPV